MNRLILCLLLACVLLENKLYFCTVISTKDKHTVDISKDSINSLFPDIPNFARKVSVSFSPLNDHQLTNGIGVVDQNSNQNDFEKLKSNVLKAIHKVDHSKSVKEMVKGLQQFPTNIFDENQHQQLNRKLEKEFNNVMVEGDTVLQMAVRLESMGNKKSKKQIAEFNAELQKLEKQIQKFTGNFNLESKKQRKKSLKIISKCKVVVAGDKDLLKNAQRSMDVWDLLNAITEMLKSIPSKLKCLMLGYCDDDNDSTNGNDNGSNSNNNGGENANSNGNSDGNGDNDGSGHNNGSGTDNNGDTNNNDGTGNIEGNDDNDTSDNIDK